MADLWQALRDSMDGMASERSAHVKHPDVYSKTEECRAYCATKGSGLGYILKGESCLCQKSRHELLRRGANGLRPRQITTAPSPDQMSAFASCAGNPACLASVASSVANSQAEAASATATTADDSASTTSGRVEASETALSTGEGTNDSSASSSVPTASNVATSKPTTTSSNSAVSGHHSVDGLGVSTPTSVEESKNSGGLSQGSKIGLGVGLGVGLTVLIAAIVLFCLARRRKRRASAMGGKYAHAQSDLSMVEAPYPAAAGVAEVRATPIPKEYQEPPDYEPPRYSQYERDNELVEGHREAVQEFDDRASEELEPPRNVFQTPVGQSPITPLEPEAHYRSFTNAPLALAIPSVAGGASTPHSRDLSPAGGGSPVSPVSPVSAVSPISSRPSSLTRHH
ncbi:hypothetical protein AC578_10068 [Pseudocercospora eumusae]|uniref:WSC domain-containing protein n=1 Tax=Pseudocercospora eumusae TaxID=321146 RepID=A0A139H856_9PEZI|nr:hypothetical protein AC578_10068 [Pseudocercospora eumusae]